MVGANLLLPNFLQENFSMQNQNLAPIRIISFPERIIRMIPLPYGLAWMVIWQVVFLIDYLLGWSSANTSNAAVFAGMCLFFAIVCSSIIYCTRKLEEFFPHLADLVQISPDETRSWFEARMNKSYSGIGPILSGILLSMVVAFTIEPMLLQLTPETSGLLVFRRIYLIVGFFCLGISLWALLHITILPIAVTALPLRIQVNQYTGSSLHALGTTYLKMALAISMCFMAIVLVAVIAPIDQNLVLLAWLGLSALLIFGFFLLPQIGIHQVMVREKSNRMAGFSKHLEEAMDRTLTNPSPENMQRLKELFEVQNHLKSMNEWPFDLSSLGQLLTALIIPIMVALAEILFKG